MGSKTDAVRTTRRRRRSHEDGVPPDPAPLSDALPRLATALDEAAEAAGWGARPSLVRVTAWPSQPAHPGFDLGIRPLDGGDSVVEALSGFTAPPEWMAIGVVTEGNARHLVEVNAAPRRVRCVHLVDRTGASASTLRLQGEAATVFGVDDEDGRGRIDDVCRRALSLPTAPPERTTIELWALVWLDRALAALSSGADGDDGPPPTWADVAAHHPAVAVLQTDAEEWGDSAADNLVRLGTVLADVHSWPVLRAACAAGEWPVEEIAPDVAAWLDDGSFSRWVLGGYPPLAQLADAECELLAPSLRRRLRGALRSWALLP